MKRRLLCSFLVAAVAAVLAVGSASAAVKPHGFSAWGASAWGSAAWGTAAWSTSHAGLSTWRTPSGLASWSVRGKALRTHGLYGWGDFGF
jgi:hypothetical protein